MNFITNYKVPHYIENWILPKKTQYKHTHMFYIIFNSAQGKLMRKTIF